MIPATPFSLSWSLKMQDCIARQDALAVGLGTFVKHCFTASPA
jgi:hypothetical protein